jgi:uncharacterized membrane protein
MFELCLLLAIVIAILIILDNLDTFAYVSAMLLAGAGFLAILAAIMLGLVVALEAIDKSQAKHPAATESSTTKR